MDPLENRDIVIGGRRFLDLDDLEDYCGRFPEFEDVVLDSGTLSDMELRACVNTYMIAAELEYGDGNQSTPFEMRCGWYGDVFVETY